MSRSLVFSLLLGTSLVVPPTLGHSAGYGVSRDIESASVSPCSFGRLKERYYYYGNISGYSESMEIACLANETFADWILLAAHACQGAKICSQVKPKRPLFAFPAGHYVSQTNFTSPREMRYALPQYVIGYKCELRSYKTSGIVDGQDYFWECAEYRQTYAENPFVVTTIGSSAQQDDDPSEHEMPLQATIPESAYTTDDALQVTDIHP